MNYKKLILPAGILLALILALAFRSIVQNSGGHRLPRIGKIEEPDRIIIDRTMESNSLIFIKQDGKWLIENLGNDAADQNLANNISSGLKGFKLTDLVSYGEQPEKYGLAPEARLKITAFQYGKEQISFFMGKMSGTRNHTYVQLANSKNIYLAAIRLQYGLTRPMDQFRSRQIMTLNPSEISSITIQRQGKSVNLSKSLQVIAGTTNDGSVPASDHWTSSTGAENIIPSTVQSLLNPLCGLTARSFINTEKTNFIPPSQYIVSFIISSDSGEETVFIIRKENNSYVVSSMSRKPEFLVPEQAIKGILDQTRKLESEAGS